MALIIGLPLSSDGGRLAGYYLTQASPTPFVALLSLISTNVAGYTKKTTVAALYLIAVGSSSPLVSSLPFATSTRLSDRLTLTCEPVLRRKHHWAANLPTQRRSSLCTSRGDHHSNVVGQRFGTRHLCATVS